METPLLKICHQGAVRFDAPMMRSPPWWNAAAGGLLAWDFLVLLRSQARTDDEAQFDPARSVIQTSCALLRAGRVFAICPVDAPPSRALRHSMMCHDRNPARCSSTPFSVGSAASLATTVDRNLTVDSCRHRGRIDQKASCSPGHRETSYLALREGRYLTCLTQSRRLGNTIVGGS